MMASVISSNAHRLKELKMNISHISQERLLNAKIAYTSRNLRLKSVVALLQEDDVIPNAGDMLLAKVTKTGYPAGLELTKLTLDFTHAGFPSTYLATPEQIDSIVETLVTHLSVTRVDAIVIEVADGLLQGETAALLNSRVFAKIVDSVILAAGDVTDAAAGVECLKRKKLPVTAISGRLTASPLAII